MVHLAPSTYKTNDTKIDEMIAQLTLLTTEQLPAVSSFTNTTITDNVIGLPRNLHLCTQCDRQEVQTWQICIDKTQTTVISQLPGFPLSFLEKIPGFSRTSKTFFSRKLYTACALVNLLYMASSTANMLDQVHCKDEIPRCIMYGMPNVSKFIVTLFQ